MDFFVGKDREGREGGGGEGEYDFNILIFFLAGIYMKQRN